MRVQSLGLEEEMATHSSILPREIPRTEEAGRLQSIESQRIGHSHMTEHAHSFYTEGAGLAE